ncbi:MAG: GPR endopeptidase [Bacilli bacterium]
MLDFDEFYYTDFVDEKQLKEKNNSGKKTYVSTNRTENDIAIKKFNILTSNNPFNKKIGNYISIDFQNVDTIENTLNILNVVKTELKYLLKRNHYKKGEKVLIVGLGNDFYISDSLGPKVVKSVHATSHLKINSKYGNISTLIPGVMASTGLESSSIIEAIVLKENIKFVVVIDALATRNIDRLYNVIQLSDTGINPGSGVDNHRKEVSKEVLGVPVICIGVATVVDCASLIVETLLCLDIEFDKEKYDLIKNICVKNNEKLVLTLKDIDKKIDELQFIISSSLNDVFKTRLME